MLAVVASPALIPLGSKLDPLQFAEFPLLQNAGRPSLWLNWLRLAKLSYSGRIQGTRFAHHEMIINAAIHGLGLAVVPTFYIRQEVASGQLHMPFGEPVQSDVPYYLVYPERKFHNPMSLSSVTGSFVVFEKRSRNSAIVTTVGGQAFEAHTSGFLSLFIRVASNSSSCCIIP